MIKMSEYIFIESTNKSQFVKLHYEFLAFMRLFLTN